MTRHTLLPIPVLLTSTPVLASKNQEDHELDSATTVYAHSIDIRPLSPFIHIYALQYSHQLSREDELIAGLAYMNIRYDFGSTHAPALLAGYRRFLWKKLHIEYQLWPVYDSFFEQNEAKYYNSFDVWNEFRLGYQFDMDISGLPCYSSVQWPFGFGLYASNKPKSFKDHEKENRFFFFPPLLFAGIRM